MSGAKRKGSCIGRLFGILLVLLIAVGAAVGFRMYPLQVEVQAPESLTTIDGRFEELTFQITSNQPILAVKYALAPEDPADMGAYTAAESAGSYMEQTLTLKDLTVDPGTETLYIYVKTLLSDYTAEFEVTFDIGYTAAPDMDKVTTNEEGLSYLVNELVISFREGTTQEEAQQIIAKYGGTVVGQIYLLDQYQVRFDIGSAEALKQMAEKIRNEAAVEIVSYNLVNQGDITMYPNDSEYDEWDVEKPAGNNWGLECIDAPGAWAYLDQMQTVKVGVMDTMLDYDHEDLQIDPDKIFFSATDSFKSMDELLDYYKDNQTSHRCPGTGCVFCGYKNHGTHVTGIIGAHGDNGKGVAGVNLLADMYFSTAWWYDISGAAQLSCAGTTERVYLDMVRMVTSGCRVINMSFGESEASKASEEEIESAREYNRLVSRLEQKGYDFLIVKSSGNESMNGDKEALNRFLTYGESARAHTIVVGAIQCSKNNRNGNVQYPWASFANYGDLVDVAAPGVDIYNTYHYAIGADKKYDNMTGTSMASPMVAGVASLAYAVKPDATYAEVKQAVCTATDTYTSKWFKRYPVVNAKMVVEYMLQEEADRTEPEPFKGGFITGLVQDAQTEDVIEDVSVFVTNTDTNVTWLANVVNGEYYMFADAGTYDLEFWADGYLPETIYGVVVEEGVQTYNVLLNLVANEKQVGVAEGRIVDAFDASSIPGAVIKVYRGVNHTAGDPVTQITSDGSGKYSLEMEPGNYTIQVTADGYTGAAANILVLPGETRRNQDCTLTPVLGDGELRVVLTWGQFPYDLDSHLTGPTPDGGRFHTYWRTSNRNYFYNGERYVNLDVDDTDSYGPETTSVYVPTEGTYLFQVHDYSNRDAEFSKSMATSNAQVKVYVGGRAEPYVFNAPTTDGTLWTVFSVTNGQLKAINMMSYHTNAHSVGD